MIVWGGVSSGGRWNNGGRSNLRATLASTAPPAYDYHPAVWTGSEMIVWGGLNSGSVLNTGGRYNPGTDSWTATSSFPTRRSSDLHTAVWTGSEMIVWGGLGSGGR